VSKPIPVFHNFIGQRRIVGVLYRIIAGAKLKGESCLDIALFGGSGLGKTAMAEAIAKEFGTKVHFFFGSEKLTRAIIIAAAKTWERCDFIFLDETHRLAPEVQEIFYRIMTDRKISLAGAECDGVSRNGTSEISVPPVTIVIATDQPGRLNTAFKKRFTFEFNLQPYSQRELVAIVRAQFASSPAMAHPVCVARSKARAVIQLCISSLSRNDSFLLASVSHALTICAASSFADFVRCCLCFLTHCRVSFEWICRRPSAHCVRPFASKEGRTDGR